MCNPSWAQKKRGRHLFGMPPGIPPQEHCAFPNCFQDYRSFIVGSPNKIQVRTTSRSREADFALRMASPSVIGWWPNNC